MLFVLCYTEIKSTGSYRYDGEHGVSLGVSEEHVNEGDDLQRLAQAHAVGQDAAEPAAAAEALHRLHQVVVQEPDPTDLRGRRQERQESEAQRTRGTQLQSPFLSAAVLIPDEVSLLSPAEATGRRPPLQLDGSG